MGRMSRRVFVKGATLAPLALSSLPAIGQQASRAPGERFDRHFNLGIHVSTDFEVSVSGG